MTNIGDQKKYIKGNREDILNRKDNIQSITVFCPVNFDSLRELQLHFNDMLPQYKSDENRWLDVPCIDALKVFLVVVGKYGIANSYPIDVITSLLKSFLKLKYIDFEFVDDTDLMSAFNYKNWKENKDEHKKIFRIKRLEFNLSNMFSQDIIDIFNKVLMLNEIIPNSYLDRKFEIDFSYEEYISFMDMFLGNNANSFNMLDGNICDYFRSFPQIVIDNMPDIKIITNYSQL